MEEEERSYATLLRKNGRRTCLNSIWPFNAGLRKGSQDALRLDMVDWKLRELHIPNTETKDDQALHVPLNSAIAALKAVFEAGEPKGRVQNRRRLAIRLRTDATGSMMR